MTKYNSTMGNLAAPDIIKRLEKSKAIKYARSIGYHYATAKAKYAGMNVKGQA